MTDEKKHRSHGMKSRDLSRSHGRLAVRAIRKPRELLSDTPDLVGAWRAKVITLFPDAFPGVLGHSLTGRALQDGKWALELIDLRQFGIGKHKNVDDTPAGGGAGMVLRADVVGAAFDAARPGTPTDPNCWPVIYLSPRGKPFSQDMAQKFSKAVGVTILCGRFEGVDERALEEYNVQEVSLGDFVLTGGEIAAQAVIDATIRLLPDVLGNADSTLDESHSNGLLEHPQYTRPADYKGRTIPEVLSSGHHGRVDKWRKEQAKQLTKTRRSDMWDHYTMKDTKT